MTPAPPPGDRSTRAKLLSLLDYVAAVVRLDARTALTLTDDRLPDGTRFAIGPADTAALPGVRHDTVDEDGPVWLAVERLARTAPPSPPDALAAWIAGGGDPGRAPALRSSRVVAVDEAGRTARIAAGACPTSFELEPDQEGSAPRYRQTLCLADQPSTEALARGWIADMWCPWATAEAPQRRTIALYDRLYRLLQQREAGGVDAPVEILWGIGRGRWTKDGRTIDRPLIERPVDLELDAAAGGLLRVRPTLADATVDLSPYEVMGCGGLGPLDIAMRAALAAAAGDEGTSPFHRASFEPALALAAARLDPDAVYRPDAPAGQEEAGGSGPHLTIDGGWVLFARPRTAHVLLADLERLTEAAGDVDRPVEGLAARIVTDPSLLVPGQDWAPLSDTLGESVAPPQPAGLASLAAEVFFPKPFNDDQVEIVRRLARGEGLVVQGPPGTGKTHTIANLICHSMATGQRVLVVSRGEAALAVLRDQLPPAVRPLAIALLSNERQGLGQVEAAIREIQAMVDASRPDLRHAAIRRCEAAILEQRQRRAGLDAALEALAAGQAERVGPRAETPAELALRVAASRPALAWFTDRPAAYAGETDLTDRDLAELAAARRRVGGHLGEDIEALPSSADLPDAATVAAWHRRLLQRARADPTDPVVAPGEADAAIALAAALEGLTRDEAALPTGADGLLACLAAARTGSWAVLLADLSADSMALEASRTEAVRQAVTLPPGLIDDPEARAAIDRGARGERPWPVLTLGRAGPKARLAAVRMRGAPLRDGDAPAWAAVAAHLAFAEAERDVAARWQAFATAAGAAGPVTLSDLAIAASLSRHRALVRDALERVPGLRHSLPVLDDPTAAMQDRAAAAAAVRRWAETAHGTAASEAASRLRALFATQQAPAAAMARRFFDTVLGQDERPAAQVASLWDTLRALLDRLHGLAPDVAAITAVTARIAAAGAPAWADRLRHDPARAEADPLIPAGWRETWDLAAADAHLGRIDARGTLQTLSLRRHEAERAIERLVLDLVRERTFYMLERRLSPGVKSALVTFVRALGRLGKGTGRSAARQRRTARDAMRRCYAAIPCWIMPSWRVSEQLPADLAAFDLVILDEASQSDVTELPAVLRGRKILVVGDDRQVSPMMPFVPQAKIDHLRDRYLRDLPFASLLEPGESLYTLMQAVFPDARLMLKEHFRCVEPIIRFSMPFYPETLIPLRVPAAAERLDPPLIDILVPHGERDKGRKINRAEAAVIVEEIARMAAEPAMATRTIGVISLIGGDQAQLIRVLLEERLGATILQRHAVLCGDSATFQGNERDVVFLSLVADGRRRTTLTMARYEQRFNVAMSRARDRVVLVRSVTREGLNPADLKARLIAHFEDPMPVVVGPGDDILARCESDFERAVAGRLLAQGFAVTPQVGALGFRIDLVVEGAGGRRLAVECDGDRFHGPGQWREDMRRQRVLERVGWRFWRCFASSFYADPDGVTAELVDTLARAGIAPREAATGEAGPSPWVEHRVAAGPADTVLEAMADTRTARPVVAGIGDRIVVSFADDRRPVAFVLSDGVDAPARGLVPLASPLGQALLGLEPEDEVELPFAAGPRKVMVERVEPLVRTDPT